MHAMALTSSPNSLLGCSHPPSLILHSSQRQVWQRKGGVLISASAAGSEHSSRALVPALRGKDYGKSKMKYPDYVETESGLQYKGGHRRGGLMINANSRIEDSSTAVAAWRTQTKARRAKPYIVAASSNEGDETKEASEAPSSITEVTKPSVSEKRAQAEAEVKKGQTTAIVTGVISVLLGVGYLVLIQLLDTRGIILVPPPPEAFDP